MNAGERPAEDRRNALYMRTQQNSAAARLTMHFGVAAGLTAVEKPCLFRAQLEQTSTGKAVSSVDTGNIVNNSHL